MTAQRVRLTYGNVNTNKLMKSNLAISLYVTKNGN